MKLREYAGRTDKGPYLNFNEDGIGQDLNKNIFIVVDSFGGFNVGDVLAKQLVKDITNFYGNFSFDRNATLPFFYSPRYLIETNALINACCLVNKELMQDNLSKAMAQRAGASGVFLTITDSIVTLLCVGSVRAYLHRRGQLFLLAIEDDMKFIQNYESQKNFCSLPMSAFGLYQDLSYQVKEIRPIAGDQIIMMTDGIYHYLTEIDILSKIFHTKKDLNDQIYDLMNIANAKGSMDNMSCMILQF